VTKPTKLRKQRKLKPGSRHIPVHVARLVWERDGYQCTFVDNEGQRCSARRYLSIEHCQPFSLGGPADPDNLVLLCLAHNQHRARQVFGETHIAKKRAERELGTPEAPIAEVPAQCIHRAGGAPIDGEQATRVDHAARNRSETDDRSPRAVPSQSTEIYEKVGCALLKLGFRQRETGKAIAKLKEARIEARAEPLLRAALQLLTDSRSALNTAHGDPSQRPSRRT
jgi:hypothetical protein